MKDCSVCARFLDCDDPGKASGFSCDLFAEYGADVRDPEPEAPKTEAAAERTLESRMAEAMSGQGAMPPDMKIDDGDLPQAPNFYAFCKDGLRQPPFPKQFALMIHLFGEWCPRCTDESLFEDVHDFPVDASLEGIESDVKLLRHGKCPSCGATKRELVMDKTLPDYSELVLVAGQRSGKSLGTSLAQAYLTHRFLKLQNPAAVYGQTVNTHFTGTMVGLTMKRAKDLLYIPFTDLLEQSPWFKAYHEMLDHCAAKYGEETWFLGKELLYYRHRQLMIHPTSPSKRTLRGDTRAWAAVDELGWMPFDSEDRERAGANEVYKALDRSLLTLRTASRERMKRGYFNVPNAYGLYLSSPSAHNDKIMSLWRAAEYTPSSLALKLPTWEMNPLITRDNPDIEKEYRQDPVGAERDYGANPPMADSAFISDPMIFKDCFSKKRNLLGKYRFESVPGRQTSRGAKFLAPLREIDGPCVMAIDAGHSVNSFALAVGRLRKRPEIVGLMEIMPQHDMPVNHSHVFEEVLLPVAKAMSVTHLFVDRWQSIKIVQDMERQTGLRGREVEGLTYSLKRGDFDYVLDCMTDDRISPVFPKLECPWPECMTKDVEDYPQGFKYQPLAHLVFQMATVRDVGRTIDKGAGYTDDLFRAVMLLLSRLYDKEFADVLRSLERSDAPRKPAGVAAFAALSDASSGPGMQTGGSSVVVTSAGRNPNLKGKSAVAASWSLR